jgi:hypothetical protein
MNRTWLSLALGAALLSVGYPNVPSHPASHDCERVSMGAMDYLWSRLPIGTPVLVY